MSATGLKKTGIPQGVYRYSLDVVRYIEDKLGVMEGQYDFSQKFKALDNLMDGIRTLIEYQKQGLLTKSWPRVACKTKLNPDAISKLNKIVNENIYDLITYNPNDSSEKISEEIIFERPINMLPNQQIHDLPTLDSLKPEHDNEINILLCEIGENILERDAYEGQDPKALDQNGCHDIVTQKCKVCGIIGHQAWFTSIDEINNSYNYTNWVSKTYYKKCRKRFFNKIKEYTVILKTNCVVLAKEIQGFDSERAEAVPDVKPPE